MMSLIKKFSEPIKFSFIYIGIIIICSIIYCSLGNQLYNSTVQNENDEKVEKIIKSNVIEYYQQNLIYVDNNKKGLLSNEEFLGKIHIEKKDFFTRKLQQDYDSYWGMFCLGMVTITTISYGYIVSFTNLARIVVGIGSVAVTFIIVWFVNSIIIDTRKDEK